MKWYQKKFTFTLKDNDTDEKEKLVLKTKTLETELFNIQSNAKELIFDYINDYNQKLSLVKNQIIKCNDLVFKSLQTVPIWQN